MNGTDAREERSAPTCRDCGAEIRLIQGPDKKWNRCEVERLAFISKAGVFTLGYRLHRDFCPNAPRRE